VSTVGLLLFVSLLLVLSSEVELLLELLSTVVSSVLTVGILTLTSFTVLPAHTPPSAI